MCVAITTLWARRGRYDESYPGIREAIGVEGRRDATVKGKRDATSRAGLPSLYLREPATSREPMPRPIHRRPDADPKAGARKYPKATFADPVNKKYPIDTPGRIKAAWAYIHQPSNAAKYTAGETRTIRARIRRAAKARKVTLPDPDEFVELMARVRKRRRASGK